MNILHISNNNEKILIDRKSFFYDAYDQIMSRRPYDLKNGFCIEYKGEEGVDVGGLLR